MTARAIVIGEGISGQATALELLERNIPVLLITGDPAPHTESAARRSGIDAAIGEGDDPERHARDLGSERALDLCRAAPELLERLSAVGVPFLREKSGPSLARSLGQSIPRTAHAGSRTASHVSRRLAARLRSFDGSALERHEGWDVVRFLSNDSGRIAGVVARDRRTGLAKAFGADGVCLATGGYAGLFDAHSSTRSRGTALGAAFRHGALLEISGTFTQEIGYAAGGLARALPDVLFANGAKLWADDPLDWDPTTSSLDDLARSIGDGAELESLGCRLLLDLGARR